MQSKSELKAENRLLKDETTRLMGVICTNDRERGELEREIFYLRKDGLQKQEKIDRQDREIAYLKREKDEDLKERRLYEHWNGYWVYRLGDVEDTADGINQIASELKRIRKDIQRAQSSLDNLRRRR